MQFELLTITPYISTPSKNEDKDELRKLLSSSFFGKSSEILEKTKNDYQLDQKAIDKFVDALGSLREKSSK